MNSGNPEGATPLDPDEAEGLRLSFVTTREQLNIHEQENIRRATEKAFAGKSLDILNEGYIRKLHREMFGEVWKWAGRFRSSNRNIGVMREDIGVGLRHLCENTRYWIDHHSYEPDEIAVRFHHRLVVIHPFANGNGRHARLMTDLLLEKLLHRPRFSWGSASLYAGESRNQYIAALRAADAGDYRPLLAFVRS